MEENEVSSIWKEARYSITESLHSRAIVILIWVITTLLTAGYLIEVFLVAVGPSIAVSIIVGEMFALGLYALARWIRSRIAYISYSIRRVLHPEGVDDVIERLRDVISHIRDVAEVQLGSRQHQAFLLRLVREDPDVPEEQQPQTYGHLAEAIALEYADRISIEEKPWPSLKPLLGDIQGAVDRQRRLASLRDVLTDAFLEVSPYYRTAAIRPPPGPLGQWVDQHSRALQLIVIFDPLVSSSALLLNLLV